MVLLLVRGAEGKRLRVKVGLNVWILLRLRRCAVLWDGVGVRLRLCARSHSSAMEVEGTRGRTAALELVVERLRVR